VGATSARLGHQRIEIREKRGRSDEGGQPVVRSPAAKVVAGGQRGGRTVGV
jgi:hypothetical protein